MCGVAGIVDLKGFSVQSSRIDRMVASLRHRGPDDQGVWSDGEVTLGHTRLAVIDLTPTGSQPMVSRNRRYVITFNGEIYNHAAIRAELEQMHVTFRGRSDTEVLLEGYARWGAEVLQHIEGMFAFAVWDTQARELFLARDRFGEKPLHYVHYASEFMFASEIKGLLQAGSVGADWDPCALSDYLSFGYVLTPKTIYRDIRRLPAGNYAVLKDGRLDVRQYWDLRAAFTPKTTMSSDECAEQLRDRLNEAVAMRRIADVPLGSFLSGGVDSSSVIAAMCGGATQPLTFNIAFRTSGYDESEWARSVSRHLGTAHTSETLDLAADVFRALPAVFDEPFADTSAIPTWLLARMTRRHVTVALSGDGADELLAGYSTHTADEYYRHYHLVPGPARRVAAAMAERLPHDSARKIGADYKLRQFLIAGTDPPWRAHLRWRELFSAASKQRILNSQMIRETAGYDPFEVCRAYFDTASDLEFLDACLYVDVKTWLQDDILVKVDRTTMAHSLETRMPFLDTRLASWCAALPVDEKRKGRRGKIVLKNAMRSRLPDAVVNRPKSGFNAPTCGLSLDIPETNAYLAPGAAREHRTEFQRYSLAVLGLHLAKM